MEESLSLRLDLIHKGQEKMGKEVTGNLDLGNSLCNMEFVVLSSQVDYFTPLGSTPLLAFTGSNIIGLHNCMSNGIVFRFESQNALSRS